MLALHRRFYRQLTFIVSFTLMVLFLSLIIQEKAQGAVQERTQATAKTTPLRIAVASNFTPALNALLQQFHQQTNIKTQVISGASGALFLQINHGAPFDVFLSADSKRPMLLQQAGLIVENSLKTYAYGQLALYSAKTNTPIALESLKALPERFAIANPDIAPYGIAAKQVFQSLKLWQKYQRSHVFIKGINIGQTFQHVRSQAVSVGIVAQSQLVFNHLEGTLIPPHYYQPIKQQLVILGSSKNKQNAEKFVEYILSKPIQARIAQLGYLSTVKVK